MLARIVAPEADVADRPILPMPAPITYPPELIAWARQRYRGGDPVERIAAETNVSTGTLYKWLAGKVPGMRLTAIPLRRPDVTRLRLPKKVRFALVTRLWRAAEQQVLEIEARFKGADRPKPERDRDTRQFAVLVKTLRELAALDAEDRNAAAKPQPAVTDDDVRDIDEFRRDLARQMDAIIAARADRVRRESTGS